MLYQPKECWQMSQTYSGRHGDTIPQVWPQNIWAHFYVQSHQLHAFHMEWAPTLDLVNLQSVPDFKHIEFACERASSFTFLKSYLSFDKKYARIHSLALTYILDELGEPSHHCSKHIYNVLRQGLILWGKDGVYIKGLSIKLGTDCVFSSWIFLFSSHFFSLIAWLLMSPIGFMGFLLL